MKGIEKLIRDYLQYNGPMISNEDLITWASRDANATINTIFSIASEAIDDVTGNETLDKLIRVLNTVTTIISNVEDVNRKIVTRKIQKLYEKIERVKVENKKKFKNVEGAIYQLDRVQETLENLNSETEKKDTKQFDFISGLINTVKNLTYIDYTLKKVPSLMNAKDKNQKPLIHHLVNKYIKSVVEENDDDILYYNNLIALVLSKKSLTLTPQDRRETIDILNNAISKLVIDKKRAKANKYKINWLNSMIDVIKGSENKDIKKIEILANKYNISVFFDEELIEKAKLVQEPKEGTMTDREVIDDYIITIDKENAKEIDDALSCRKLPNGNYLLGVHIASILGYFPYESDIVQEALNRNHSIYLPNVYQQRDDDFCRTIPIFPYAFSANNASLLPGVNRLARSYLFEIDRNGNIVNERFVKSIIKTSKKASYNEINSVIEHGSNDKKLDELITNLQDVITLLDSKYSPTELYEQIKEYTDDYSDLRVKRVGAEKIVYQAMLLTGNRVAEYFARNNYPLLYRVHEVNEDNVRKLSALVDSLTKSYGGEQFAKLYQLIEGLYPKGWYETQGSHDGLGLEHYCHCTSGLRRAADIIVEHALEVCYDREPTKEELEELEAEINNRKVSINSKEGPIEWFIKDYARSSSVLRKTKS